MRILIIGSGGREHALAECFARSKDVTGLIVAPGNPGIAMQYECQPLYEPTEICSYCKNNAIDMVFIGPEQPIADGLSDLLTQEGIDNIAPSKFAAQLESSKIFAKELMREKGIPTANYMVAKSKQEAEELLAEFSYPVVIKADGLAAGKGVFIAKDSSEAIMAINNCKLSEQGVILEEFLQGWEVSLFAITDGTDFISTIFAQDHKQLLDGDLGPNTGGMGAYAPVPEAEQYRKQIEEEIIAPTLAAMRELGHPYKGILYCGLMITKQGPKVIEFNCRLGDPEAEVLLPLLETDLLLICQAILNNDVKELQVKFTDSTALAVVLASGSYPISSGDPYPICLPEPLPGGVYFSGVSQGTAGLLTAGGRVLCVLGLGADISAARQDAYSKLEKISFTANSYRKDIGLRKNSL